MKKLVWDEWNKKHIRKHNVTIDEVEEIYKNKRLELDSYLNRKELYGVTKKGRMVIIVVSYTDNKNPYVFSARDMSRKERKNYYEKTKTNTTI
jgi:uncharacterized DUF497 family protein